MKQQMKIYVIKYLSNIIKRIRIFKKLIDDKHGILFLCVNYTRNRNMVVI